MRVPRECPAVGDRISTIATTVSLPPEQLNKLVKLNEPNKDWTEFPRTIPYFSLRAFIVFQSSRFLGSNSERRCTVVSHDETTHSKGPTRTCTCREAYTARLRLSSEQAAT